MRILIGIIAALALPASVLAEPAAFPAGARIGLAPPAGFEPATSFVGFENKAQGSAIVVGDLPEGTFAEMLPTFSPEGMARGGFRASGPAVAWPVTGADARLLRGHQASRGIEYRRWLVLARVPGTAALVSAMVPEAGAAAAEAGIEAALRTIAFRRPPGLAEQIEALPFRIGDPTCFRPVLAMGGLSLILTEGAGDKPRAADQPLVYVVAHQSGAQGGRDANSALARELFLAVPTLKAIVATRSEELQSGALSRIEGTAVEQGTEAAVEVLQIVYFGGGGYLRAVGIWRPQDAERFRARFERLAASIALR